MMKMIQMKRVKGGVKIKMNLTVAKERAIKLSIKHFKEDMIKEGMYENQKMYALMNFARKAIEEYQRLTNMPLEREYINSLFSTIS